MKYLLIAILLLTTPAYAKECCIYNDKEFQLSQEREIKNILRKKFYKNGEAKKIKLHACKKYWEIVNA